MLQFKHLYFLKTNPKYVLQHILFFSLDICLPLLVINSSYTFILDYV